MRGRMGIGSGAGSGLTARTHGGTGGAETHTLSTGQLPPHDHPLEIVPGAGTGTTEPQAGTSYYLGGVGGRADGGPYTAVSPDPTTTVEGSRIVGAGDPVPHMPPFLAMNWIIKL
jgi:microcystin-dependent protein